MSKTRYCVNCGVELLLATEEGYFSCQECNFEGKVTILTNDFLIKENTQLLKEVDALRMIVDTLEK